MKRRRYLCACALAAGLAGCSLDDAGTDSPGPDGGDDSDGADGGDGSQEAGSDGASDSQSGDGDGEGDSGGSDGDGTSPGSTEPAAPQEGQALRDIDLPIPREELNRGAVKDGIPAIVNPAFGDNWDTVGERSDSHLGDLSLEDDEEVLGVVRDGRPRAYPLRVLTRHEIVNDRLDGPLLVTFCPLCGSGVTAERTVDGEATVFGVSGLLWKSDLVMYDRKTQSLWSQIYGAAIHGQKTGTELTLVPSSRTTWGEWQSSHPDTKVLLPPPQSDTITGVESFDYTYNPYEGYDENTTIGIGYNEFDDDRLHPKTMVVGVTDGGVARAYPLSELEENTTITDTVGDLPVVVTTTGEGSQNAYERTVDGETLEFENGDDDHMKGGGSRWEKVSGQAIDGPHSGEVLTRANDRSPMFWFAWLDFHPESEIYRL